MNYCTDKYNPSKNYNSVNLRPRGTDDEKTNIRNTKGKWAWKDENKYKGGNGSKGIGARPYSTGKRRGAKAPPWKNKW